MDQIGFTFYPRDWWTSDRFFELELGIERYVYLECLFVMYSDAKGVRNDREFMSKKLRLEIPPPIWESATKSFTRVGDYLQSETVKKRRTKAEAARINGAKGGRPADQNQKPKNPEMQTHGKPSENPNNPRYKEKEKVKGNNTLSVGERVYTDNARDINPPLASPSPLWAVGTPGGSIDAGIWGEYGARLEKSLPRITRGGMLSAWLFFWPHKLTEGQVQEVSEILAQMSDQKVLDNLASMADTLTRIGKDGTQKVYLSDFENPIEFLAL